MNINDLISRLASHAARHGTNAEVLIRTGNVAHVDWTFDRASKVLVLELDMEGYAEAQAEALPNTAPVGICTVCCYPSHECVCERKTDSSEPADSMCDDGGWGDLDREVPSWKDPHRSSI